MTPKLLIINDLMCHLSLVTFALTLSLFFFARDFMHGFIGFDVDKGHD